MNNNSKKICSVFLACMMFFSIMSNIFIISASAEDESDYIEVVTAEDIVDSQNESVTTDETVIDVQNELENEETDTTNANDDPIICTLCGGEHNILDCDKKCLEHGIEHLDINCTRHLICSLCGVNGHKSEECPEKCALHGAEHKDMDCERHLLVCDLCGKKEHIKNDCPERCEIHGAEHTNSQCPNNFKTNDNVYVANYQVVDNNGSVVANVKPGDKVIVAVSIIDERIKFEDFAIPANTSATNRIHISMAQGAFSINSSSDITSNTRQGVNVNSESGAYTALCYTIEFRNVTYLGGEPEFDFSIAYTGYGDNPVISNNVPLPYEQKHISVNVSQASDDATAPTVILNKAEYGNMVTVGQPFTLYTTATNTSENLKLENVSVKIELPSGINMASGNNHVLIGEINEKGNINHNFNLIVDKAENDITSMPVKLIYSFEARVGGKRTQYTSEQEVSISVQQPTRFEIQSIASDIEMFVTDESFLSTLLANKGKTIVYNVTAELISNTLSAYDVQFLGNIAPGTSAEATFDFTASEVGTSTGKVYITYEDAAGMQHNMERDFSISVVEEMEWDEPVLTPPTPTEQNNNNTIVFTVISLTICAATGLIIYRKKKAKSLSELEDEDEDI